MITLSNPRESLTVEDWPLGREHTTKCTFEVEYRKGKGHRISRVTNNRYGIPCKPKKTVYSPFWCIVEGSDEKTYLLSLTEYGSYVVTPGTMKGNEHYTQNSNPVEYAHCVEVMKEYLDARRLEQEQAKQEKE